MMAAYLHQRILSTLRLYIFSKKRVRSMILDVVNMDLLDMALDFLPLTTLLGPTNLVLIPKVDKPESYAKFRPISLCSINYKILSKIFVMRSSPLLGSLISKEQSAFILGRSIF